MRALSPRRDLLVDTARHLVAGSNGGGASSSGGGAGSSIASSSGGRGGAGPPSWRACADLGCGTGLMGPLLRPDCGRLVGVDLSAGMCDKARARGCYDSVHVCELVEWLQALATGGGDASSCGGGGGRGFDLLVAADVLVYIGDLQPLLAAAGDACSASG